VLFRSGVGIDYLLPPFVDKMYAMPTQKVENGYLELSSRWRLIKPVLKVSSDEHEFDVTPMPGMSLVHGKYHLDTEYAGNGAPGDYEQLDVDGKAVVVDRHKSMTAAEQASAALEAGAELLIIVNDSPGNFSEFVGNDDLSDIPLAVASMSGTEGARLITSLKQGNV